MRKIPKSATHVDEMGFHYRHDSETNRYSYWCTQRMSFGDPIWDIDEIDGLVPTEQDIKPVRDDDRTQWKPFHDVTGPRAFAHLGNHKVVVIDSAITKMIESAR